MHAVSAVTLVLDRPTQLRPIMDAIQLFSKAPQRQSYPVLTHGMHQHASAMLHGLQEVHMKGSETTCLHLCIAAGQSSQIT